MKWFMHDSRARNDAKLAKIILRHGIEGYGLYFACIEIIADELTPSNFNFELEHDSELLAAMFRMDTLKVEKIMRDFVELGLFEYSEATHRVACYKLAKRLDNATSQNKEVQSILKNFKELKETSSNLKQIRLDKTRLEEIREEGKGGDCSGIIDGLRKQHLNVCGLSSTPPMKIFRDILDSGKSASAIDDIYQLHGGDIQVYRQRNIVEKLKKIRDGEELNLSDIFTDEEAV